MKTMLDEQRAGLRSGLTTALEACIALNDRGFVEPSDGASSAPVFLSYYPYVHNNPYQDLLYCRALDEGFTAVPLLSLDDAEAFQWPGAMVLHLHWMNAVLRDCKTMEAARARIDAFMAQLGRARGLGYHTVWSIHNVLPHDAENPEFEVLLSRRLADEADTIHILNENTLDETAPYFSIDPDKVLYSPIPAYDGIYPDTVTDAQAREALGFASSDFVIVLFGSIMRYKGTIEFIEAVDALKARGGYDSLKVVVVGPPGNFQARDELVARYAVRADISIVAERIDPNEVQNFLRAADFVACPYLQSLNSSVAMVALTFGRPVLAPHKGCFADLAERIPNAVLTYAPDDPGGLTKAIELAMAQRGRGKPTFEGLEDFRPDRISRVFFDAVRARLAACAAVGCKP
jgi:beta-1,4-mannosyltransferase